MCRRYQQLHVPVPGEVRRFQLPDALVALRLQAVPQRGHLREQRLLFVSIVAARHHGRVRRRIPLSLSDRVDGATMRVPHRLVSWFERSVSQRRQMQPGRAPV